MSEEPSRLIVDWETTDTDKAMFEENTDTIVEKSRFVELPKYRLRAAANFAILKEELQRFVGKLSFRKCYLLINLFIKLF